ncbi:MAG: hypothetical protein ABEI06_10450, partial [Halobacteriaceae archaeon]
RRSPRGRRHPGHVTGDERARWTEGAHQRHRRDRWQIELSFDALLNPNRPRPPFQVWMESPARYELSLTHPSKTG